MRFSHDDEIRHVARDKVHDEGADGHDRLQEAIHGRREVLRRPGLDGVKRVHDVAVEGVICRASRHSCSPLRPRLFVALTTAS